MDEERNGDTRTVALTDLAKNLGINIDRLRGILEELRRQGKIRIVTEEEEYLSPDTKLHGKLPELEIYKTLKEKGGMRLQELKKTVNLDEKDFNAGIAILVREGVIGFSNDGERVVIIKDQRRGEELYEKSTRLRELITSRETISIQEIPSEHRDLVAKWLRRPNLLKRRIIKREYVVLTEEAGKLLKKAKEKLIGSITRDMIIGGEFDLEKIKNIPPDQETYRIHLGRRHPLSETIKEVREIFLQMGFEEIEGPIIETAFVNFDMLFQPQDHPARDMHDTLYLSKPYDKTDPPYKEFIDIVAETHQHGGKTGSRGWRYKWSLEEARKTLLRTHTTAVTIRGLYENRHRDELKLFSIGRVYRNETIDYKHLSDFTQVDGILMHKDANLRLLMGILETFFKKMGAKKIRFWPTYFPFTEPSIQPTVYMEEIGEWIELGGAGIFRPEITIPMGIDKPVLAWGLGLERIIMIRYKLGDIREIYFNRADWLRNRRVLM